MSDNPARITQLGGLQCLTLISRSMTRAPATERLFPTLTAAQIARISTHGYRHLDFLSSQSESAYAHEC